MGKFIVHHDGFFFEWSTIVDAPTTYGMRRAEFEEYYRDRYGSEEMERLPERLERAVANGTSSREKMSAEDLSHGNRAGPDEAELSFGDLIRVYCHERPTGEVEP